MATEIFLFTFMVRNIVIGLVLDALWMLCMYKALWSYGKDYVNAYYSVFSKAIWWWNWKKIDIVCPYLSNYIKIESSQFFLNSYFVRMNFKPVYSLWYSQSCVVCWHVLGRLTFHLRCPTAFQWTSTPSSSISWLPHHYPLYLMCPMLL